MTKSLNYTRKSTLIEETPQEKKVVQRKKRIAKFYLILNLLKICKIIFRENGKISLELFSRTKRTFANLQFIIFCGLIFRESDNYIFLRPKVNKIHFQLSIRYSKSGLSVKLTISNCFSWNFIR